VLQNQELTAAVLSHLDSLRDIIACSAVSKCWLATVSSLAPTSLVIPGPNAKLTLTATHQILYWVQQKHSNGHFQNLHRLSVLLTASEDVAMFISDGLAAFGLAVVAFAGLWPLTVTTLGGPFMLTQIVLLLPTTLQSLRATVDPRRELDGGNISLALFKRLKSLRFLHLEFEGPASQEKTFALDAALPNLLCLHVSPCTTTCSIDSVSGLLPNVTHAAFVVRNCDAQKFADLPCIQCLLLGLIKADDGDVSFMVKADSRFRKLVMYASSGVTIVIVLHKSDFCFYCGGLGKIWAVSKAGTQEIVCRVPRNYQPLSFDDLNRICQ